MDSKMKPGVTITARIIKKDGTVVNLGVIAKSDDKKEKDDG